MCFFPSKAADNAVDAIQYCIDLGGISHTKGGNDTENAISRGKEAIPNSLTNHIHRAAKIPAVFFLSVSYRQCGFGKLCGHTQQTADPHPENTPRTAKTDRSGNTGKVSRPHGSRKSGTQCLKGRYTVTCMLFSPESGTERPDRSREQGKLGKSCTNRQEYTDTKNQDQRRCAPHKDIQSLQNFRHNASYKKSGSPNWRTAFVNMLIPRLPRFPDSSQQLPAFRCGRWVCASGKDHRRVYPPLQPYRPCTSCWSLPEICCSSR